MQMSDVFELPVEVEQESFCGIDIDKLELRGHRAKVAAYVINCHDDLVKAIENLIEADNAFKTGFLHAPELWDHALDELKCALYKARGGQ